ncbi:hypothetical protein [Pedobacter africanus]|uniref:Uncharacterized protein n=1 Tax=Pedobacter africanus TaxID=151894 RepID=A0A1W2AZX6_9SPHI|nr:hypothetical protein [Pedobacter africanus]SMC66275.1 hypothetical protein SAMN04488524_1808 [Pedobacter africanus]
MIRKRLAYTLFLFLIAVRVAYSQEMVQAEIFTIESSYKGKPYGPYLYLMIYGDLEVGQLVTSSLGPEADGKLDALTAESGEISIKGFPTYNWTNYTTGARWVLTEGERYKIATKEEPNKTTDSSSHYSLKYVEVYQKIGDFPCQKVVVTNKLTKQRDSMYVCSSLNYYNYRVIRKYGKTDFIVRMYTHENGKTQTFTVISAAQKYVPSATFKISKDYIFFNSSKEENDWIENQIKRREQMQKEMRFPFQ